MAKIVSVLRRLRRLLRPASLAPGLVGPGASTARRASVLAAVLAFTGFLLVQVVMDMATVSEDDGRTAAEVLASVPEGEYGHYESALRAAVFTDSSGSSHSWDEDGPPLVILNFWASWCVPCLEEFPSLVELRKRHGSDEVLILAVNSGEDSPFEISRIVERYGVNFPVVVDRDGGVFKSFGVSAIPLSIVFYRGRVVDVSRGYRDFSDEEATRKFRALLNVAS